MAYRDVVLEGLVDLSPDRNQEEYVRLEIDSQPFPGQDTPHELAVVVPVQHEKTRRRILLGARRAAVVEHAVAPFGEVLAILCKIRGKAVVRQVHRNVAVPARASTGVRRPASLWICAKNT